MRQGANPGKQTFRLPDYAPHRVIVPVCIPELGGYFAQSVKVLELCLESLRVTTAGRASVTVISNGCAPEVVQWLECLHRQGWIDQLLLNTSNRGKIDAVFSVARGAPEPLLTMADCDVLFRHGWLEAIEGLFNAFPECGLASPTPLPSLVWEYTTSTILGAFVNRELRFEKVVPGEDLDRFVASIDNPGFFRLYHRQSQLVVRRGDARACIGCGHFVCTVRREVLAGAPRRPCCLALGRDAERIWVDSPPDRLGFWRLATPRTYAYHMGNVPEPWMYEELERSARAMPPPADRRSPVSASRRHWTARLAPGAREICVRVLRKFRPYARYR
jgi:hypothetical protein